MLSDKCLVYSEEIINNIDKNYLYHFTTIIHFLWQEEKFYALSMKNNESEYSYIERMAKKFIKGRGLSAPIGSNTIPDSMISTILQFYFDIQKSELKNAADLHSYSMTAENMIGDLLERYLAHKLEPNWIWCSGSIVKSIDFIRNVNHQGLSRYEMLQIKNRDNSENSSSSAIRDGTNIKKWFRSFSKTGCTNWKNFPDECSLSEAEFAKFVADQLSALKKDRSV